MSLNQWQDYYAVSATDTRDAIIGIRIAETASEARLAMAAMLEAYPSAHIEVGIARFERVKTIAYAAYDDEKAGSLNLSLLD